MKKYLLLLLFTSEAFAGGTSSLNLALPSGTSSYQSDRIRAGELDCQNAIGGGTNVEFGVLGTVSETLDVIEPRTKDIGLYAKITIPLDGPKERINCNTLYLLELEKKRLEVFKLKQELQQLKALKFEN
jgi:hypothetical protein